MMEWVRFGLTAALLLTACVCYICAVLGAWRFGFILNRLHAAGIGDTAGIFFVTAALVISALSPMECLKLFFLVFFLWFSSPASTHFLAQVEYYNNAHLPDFVKRIQAVREGTAGEAADAEEEAVPAVEHAAGVPADTAGTEEGGARG